MKFITKLLLITSLVLMTALPALADRRAALAYSAPEYPAGACVASSMDSIPGTPHAHQTGLDTFDDDAEYAPHVTDGVNDPFEGWNRFWFGFNDFMYLDVIKPLHKGYSAVTPWELRAGVNNFFHNLLYPIRFVSCLLQGKFAEASVESARFVVNTTAGFGGLMNPAADNKPLIEISDDPEDLGQTFGVWGFGEGFYLVWPFLGPSSLRDTVGFAGDSFLNPVSYVTPWHSSLGLKSYDKFNSFDKQIAQYEELKKAAVEPYIAIRNAYVQSRRAHIEK
ncbi:VacJ family lipoprotein [Desulfovibrio mangrovi]|uniref:MlaA family lipoprotein n=1 Tax=Desulfovibrio mangrovi TaxID=2976983 RepID=UPI00224655E1|nr:VacJ family lipoprotein [Desulfovibrio mangrovi]UZP67797.1 VacJ family lipoprotein [Desulfovibrio mangrovi]